MSNRIIVVDAATGETEERDMTVEEAAEYAQWLEDNPPDITE